METLKHFSELYFSATSLLPAFEHSTIELISSVEHSFSSLLLTLSIEQYR